ncbi:unnamed protein product [Staurois parvus]|uniref:Uncharacterized protein n=1 Tax=Staurois parvus TaxID=386267 RepID=A0ABN9FTQ0_9NEOB|nr:unnamed protein product [Staurois parvus]
MGRRTVCKQNSFHCQLVHIRSSVLTVKHKHTQHTVNPLIAPHVNPFLSSAISTLSVYFF